MKKLLCILMALMMLTPLFATGAAVSADPVPTMTVGSCEANTGDVISIPVTISGNPGFCAFALSVDYDPTYLLDPEFTISGNLPAGQSDIAQRIVWLNGEDFTGDGEILVLNFRVANNTPDGTVLDVGISYTPGNISNYNEDDVDFTVVPGTVTVHSVAPSITIGNVEAAPGEFVEIPVNVERNPGFAAFVLGVDYSEEFLLDPEFVAGDALAAGQMAVDDKIVWLASSDFTGNGEILKLKFRVSDAAPDGGVFPVSISYAPGDISNYNEDDVSFEIVPGSVTVKAPTPVTGARLTVGNVTADAGDEVTIPVAIADNPGIVTFKVSVDYEDTYAELLDASVAGTLGGSYVFSQYLVWLGTEDFTADGNVILLRFRVSDTAPSGAEIPVSISYDPGEISNYNEDDVDLTVIPGKITVRNGYQPPLPDGAVISIGSVEGKPGEEVSVPVSLKDNPGFAAFVLTPEFDATKVQLTGVTLRPELEAQSTFNTNIVYAAAADFTEDGEFMYLIFHVADGAANGDVIPVTLSYVPGNICNYNEEDVDFTIVAGQITVKADQVVPVEDPTVTVGSAEGQRGETVSVSVRIDENPGVAAMVLSFEYDNTALNLVNVTASPILGGQATYDTNLVWVSPADFTGNGEILSLEFEILDAAEENKNYPVTIRYNPGDVCNYNEDDVNFDIVPGKVTVLHTHDYVAVVTEPSCAAQGFTTYTCACGDSYVDDFVDALGHDWGEWEVTTEPTCTEIGEETRVCARCGLEEYRDVDALGHDYVAVVTDPTCTEQGFTTYTCSRCGDTYDDDFVDALGHDYVAVVTDPTCTEQGFTTYTCSRCGDSYDDDFVDALGHDWGEWAVTTEPNCTEAGVETRICARCGETETRPVDALGHDYVAVVTDPTCTDQGFTTYTCSRCGDSYDDDFVDALGHDWGEWTVTTEPTCTAAGVENRVCARCGETETRPVDALGHTAGDAVRENEVTATCTVGGYWEEVVYCTVCGEELSREVKTTEALGHDYVAVVTEPTCTEQGYTTYTCSRCGDTFVDDYVDALGHNFGEWVVTTEPTCTAAGVETRTCGRCGETETRPVDALGHDYVAVVTDPTCTEQGYTTHTCSRCNDSYVDSYVDALGHNFGEWVVTTEPTCTAAGVETRTCGRCGETETRPVDALGHNFGEWVVTTEPTCTAAGVETRTCGRCGETETRPVDALGHNFGEWVVTTAPTCTEKGEETRTCSRCGETETRPVDALGHTAGDIVRENEVTATCTVGGYWEEVVYCTVCGEELSREVKTTEALGHDYVAVVTEPTCTEQGYTTYTCSRCNDSYVDDYVDALGHDFGKWTLTVEPTCAADGKEVRTCSRCGETEERAIAALGHEWGAWTVTTEPTCTEVGQRTRICSRCGDADVEAIEALGHDYVAIETEPTCTEQGYLTHTCSRCGDSYVDTYVDALGHDWDEGVVTRPATDRKEGIKTYTCLRCGEERTEAIPKLPLHFDDVDPDKWYTPAIEFVYENGWMEGVSETSFAPEGIMNRAMIITVLWRMEGCPKPTTEAPFLDLNDDWYLEACYWGYENGIIKGYSETKYAPEEPVKREQICAILYRYTEFKGRDVSARGDLSKFPDSSEVSKYAVDAVSWAVGIGMVNGMPKSGKVIIAPKADTTRGQAATMIMRYSGNY